MQSFFSKGRIAVLITVTVVAVTIFAARLFQWQVIDSDYYNEIASTSTSYTITTEALRGEIYDINGVDLAVNVTSYKVVIDKLYLDDDDLNDTIVRLVELMDVCEEEWIDELPITVSSSGEYEFVEDMEDEIEELKDKDNLNMNPYSTAAECMAKLVEKYDCSEYTSEQQRCIISVRYNMEQEGYSKSQPYTFATGISETAMTVISENMQDVSGVTVESTAIRTYTNGTVAPNIVGITGLISSDEYSELKDSGYAYNDIIGKSGIEASLEDYLRGENGSKTVEVSSDGTVEVVDVQNSTPGNSVYLTIDARYQLLALQALEEAVQEANDYAEANDGDYDGEDCVGAAVVVLNVKDFSVLCAASYPSYDLSEYYENYEELASDEASPLFDRAFMGALAPGSTFKPLVASAALEEEAITTSTTVTCNGIYTTGGLSLRCMGNHGSLDIYGAVKNSCNVYFAEVGRLLGIENMNIYAKRAGLGVKTGVEITESAGTLAGPDYSESVGSEWYEASVSSAAIGQSDNQFTPLQLATYVATIANNGVRLQTHVVDSIVSYSGDEIILKNDPDNPTVADDMGVSQENLDVVKEAMRQAASSYSALSDFDIEIAGKTGTAENSGSDHANFICFAPYDDPEIAIAVMVEHGTKSSVAVNVAKKILNAYFYGEGLEDIAETNKDGTVGSDSTQDSGEEASQSDSSTEDDE